MDIVSFITRLGENYAPTDPGVVTDLRIQLTDGYNKVLDVYREKKEKNSMLEFEMEKLNKDRLAAREAGDYEAAKEIADRMSELKRECELSKPTLVERSLAFLDRPYVRLALLVSFGIVSALLARWLNRRRRDDDDDERDGRGGGPAPAGGYYPPPPGYAPYPYAPYGGGRREDRR